MVGTIFRAPHGRKGRTRTASVPRAGHCTTPRGIPARFCTAQDAYQHRHGGGFMIQTRAFSRVISSLRLALATGLALAAPTALLAGGGNCGCPSYCPPQCGGSYDVMGAPATTSVDDLAFGAGAGAGSIASLASVGGYIDSAIIRTRFQLQYDRVTGGNSDRAEFLYGAYNTNVTQLGISNNGDVDGPSLVAIDSLAYHQGMAYLEYALSDYFSIFVEAGYQDNNIRGVALTDADSGITGDLSDAGFADMNAGVRYGWIADCDRWVTLQLKVFAPTGNESNALGTGHASIQPGILFQRNLDQLTVFGELHDWISTSDVTFDADDDSSPIDGDNFSGNVLRYGIGVAYTAWEDCCCCCDSRNLQLVAEFVGWTVLDGLRTIVDTTDPDAIETTVVDAEGDTIVNGKFGIRYTSGPHSIYAGYGLNLTSDRWYSDIVRVQYQYNVW
jgi:hypothetical protein